MPLTIDTPSPRILIAVDFTSALQKMVGPPPRIAVVPTEPAFANGVLDSLPAAVKPALAASLERVPLRKGEVLDVPGVPVGYVYFPVEGLISLFAGSAAATRIEVASIGCDGMTAPGILLGDRIAAG